MVKGRRSGHCILSAVTLLQHDVWMLITDKVDSSLIYSNIRSQQLGLINLPHSYKVDLRVKSGVESKGITMAGRLTRSKLDAQVALKTLLHVALIFR